LSYFVAVNQILVFQTCHTPTAYYLLPTVYYPLPLFANNFRSAPLFFLTHSNGCSTPAADPGQVGGLRVLMPSTQKHLTPQLSIETRIEKLAGQQKTVTGIKTLTVCLAVKYLQRHLSDLILLPQVFSLCLRQQ